MINKGFRWIKKLDWRMWALLAITALGAGLRLYGRAWGLPLLLHPDEWQIVDGAMYMIENHTWRPPTEIFQWPGHLIMYMSVALYKFYAAVKLHMPVEQVYAENPAVLYLLSRYITILFGVLSIVLIFLIMEKIKKNTGVIAALATAVLPVYVTNSVYATPDIPLLCVLLAAAYFGVCYTEKPNIRNLLLMCLFAGLSVTVKYSGAAACLWIALVVTMESVKRRSWKHFFAHGFLGAAAFVLFMFLFSPTLFIEYKAVLEMLDWQQNHGHLNYTPLSYLEKLKAYIMYFKDSAGYEFFPFIAVGVAIAFKERKKEMVGLLFPFLYWLCISAVNFYWVRYGIPVYAGFIMLGSIGIEAVLRLCLDLWRGRGRAALLKKVRVPARRHCFRAVSFALAAFIALVSLDISVAAALELFVLDLDDSQNVAVQFCAENGITAENAVSDGVDSLETEGETVFDLFVVEDGRLMVKGEYRNKQYLVMNSNVWGRYYSEEENYPEQVATYDRIFDELELLKQYSTVSKDSFITAVGRIAANVRYGIQVASLGYTGGGIRIMKIPEGRYTDEVESAAWENMSGLSPGEDVLYTGGSEGFVVCGPYIKMIPGSYLAEVTIALEDGWTEETGEEYVEIDVCRGGGEEVYGKIKMSAEELMEKGKTVCSLPFTLDSPALGFEFRVYETENMTLEISDLHINILR